VILDADDLEALPFSILERIDDVVTGDGRPGGLMRRATFSILERIDDVVTDYERMGKSEWARLSVSSNGSTML